MSKAKHPTVAEFIARRIRESDKSQKEIAQECGRPKPNVITMLKQGRMKLPLEKVGTLAAVLDVNPIYLLWLTMREYAPATLESIEGAIHGVMLSAHEKLIIEAY